MRHIGQCIRQQVEAQGRTSVWLAQELGCHRTNIYKIYDKMTIDTGILLRISRILNYDFFRLYSEEMADEDRSGEQR
ncbi:MAG: XRE family transcriptional regulator [Prevotella sp.]|nr:XRE family transcriptional regulator [Prevotella sp.]